MKKKKVRKFPSYLKDRWLPTNATRPQTFKDKKKEADKKACRNPPEEH